MIEYRLGFSEKGLKAIKIALAVGAIGIFAYGGNALIDERNPNNRTIAFTETIEAKAKKGFFSVEYEIIFKEEGYYLVVGLPKNERGIIQNYHVSSTHDARTIKLKKPHHLAVIKSENNVPELELIISN